MAQGAASPGWSAVAASVLEEALASDAPGSPLRRLLRGLCTLHGLHGAMFARQRPQVDSVVVEARLGHPGAANCDDWDTFASLLDADADRNTAPVRVISRTLAAGDRWLLCLSGAATIDDPALQGDALEALRLAATITAAAARRDADRETRHRLESIIEATGAGTWEWEVQTGKARMNKRWARITGDELEDLMPLSVDTWIAKVHPEDLPRCIAALEDNLTGRSDRYEAAYRLQHRDGHWVWVHDRGRVVRFTGDGRPELMVGSHVDISMLKRYEAMLEASHEELRTSTALLDAAGRIARIGCWKYDIGAPFLVWNEVVCRIHDVEPGFRPTLEEGIAFYAADSRTLIQSVVERCVADGTPWDVEAEIVTATGRRRWVRAQGEAESSDGRLVRLIGTFQDITDRRALQDALTASNLDLEARVSERTRQLEAAKRIAEEASRAKDEFLTNISHELRSPLHSVLGFSGLALDELDPVEQATLRRFVEKARASASELLKLVNDLLDAAKIESGRLVIQPEPCRLEDVAEGVVAEFEVAAGNKGLRIERHFGACTTINADPGRLAQALRNIMANAVRFSPQAGTVTLSIDPASSGVVRLVVIDQGPGIPEDELEAVFDRFTQSSRTKTGAGGTGLGLPIARGILELHGGRLWAERPAEGGSAFCLELPRG